MAVCFWVGGHYGDWSNPYDWSPALIPSTNDLAIDQSGHITATNVDITGTTIWLDYNSNESASPSSGPSWPASLSLIGSSLDSSSSLLINSDMGTATVELSNSALRGHISAASGASIMTVDAGSSAVNYGLIDVANSFYPTSTTMVASGAFANNGTIEAGSHGQFGLVFGRDDTKYQNVFNSGIIQGDPGGSIALNALQENTTSYGALVNINRIIANGASIYINSDLVQSQNASVLISGNGSLTLSGRAEGGTIQISSGSLNFSGSPIFVGTPHAAKVFDTEVDFTGASGSISFGSIPIHEEYRAMTREIFVSTTSNHQALAVADIHLGGSASYTAADFSVHGNTLTYMAPTGGSGT